jgi:peptidoglycan/xylan/chitin deacetylase (PgdA/CDA1 family)
MTFPILLSFDLEEFDAPIDCGSTISPEDQISVSVEGLNNLLPLLEEFNAKSTFFTTAAFAEKQPDIVRKLAEKHEIASHGYYHSSFKQEDLKNSKECLENIIQKEVKGFRRARLQPTDHQWILDAGYHYNSSENPTYIPGRYNNLHLARSYYFNKGLLNIPVSTMPYTRFPLFWLSFKNLPPWLLKPMLKFAGTHDEYLSLYFHPWEFADLSKYHLSPIMKKKHGMEMVNVFREYLAWFKTCGTYQTFSEFIQGAKVSDR